MIHRHELYLSANTKRQSAASDWSLCRIRNSFHARDPPKGELRA